MKGIIEKAWMEKDVNNTSLTLTHRRLKQHLTRRIQRPVSERTNFIPILIGLPGIGKSKMIYNLAMELGWVHARFDVNAQAFEENNGLPYIDVTEDGTKVAKSAPAQYLPTFATKPTLLEVGELPTAPPAVQNQIRMIIDGMFMGNNVSQFCMSVATGNPPAAEYVTMNQLDAAIEDRLDPYIVIPKTPELMAIWSKIMFPTMFRFLDANQPLVNAISPRRWMMVAEKVEDLVEYEAEPGEIIQDIRPLFPDFKNIGPLLQNFLINGNRKELRIILGREIVAYSDDHQLTQAEEKIQYWVKEDLRGLIGASNTDLIRTIGSVTEEDVKGFPRFSHNIIKFTEILTRHNCHDMARMLMDAAYACVDRKAIVETLKSSRVMATMSKRYKELKAGAAK